MKRMKKLLAGLLSLALAMSLAVPAFADGAAGGEKNTYDAATDSLDGEIGNEGPIEANKIKIILPTVAASTYDMILDPHSLIKRSNNARYTAQKYAFTYGGEANAKEGANRLFFRTSETKDDGGTVTAINWTKDSAEATITNKGMDDITVTLTVEVDPKTNDFDFVDSEADLTSTTDAQMYLAVVSGTKSQAVAAPAENAEATLGDPTVAVTSQTVNWLKAATFAWADATDDQKAEFNDDFDNITLTVTADADTTLKYTVAASGSNLYVDTDTAVLDIGTGAQTLGVDIYTADTSTKLATVTLSLDSANVSSGNATAKISKGVASQPKATAVLNVDVAGSPDAFTETHDATKGYIWTDVSDFDTTSFKKMSFNLTGNINTADAWDTLSGSGNKIGVKVIWKADQKVASESDDNSDSGNSGNSGTQTPAVTDAAPKAKVTTASSASAGTVVIEYDLGSGSNAKAKVNRVLYTRSGNEQAFANPTIDTDAKTITIAPAGLIYSQGGSWKVEFTDNDGNNAVTALVDSIKAVSADWVEAS